MTIDIKYLGHSAFLITGEDYSIIIDPFISGNPSAKIDVNLLNVTDILVTHAHADHLGDAIPISRRTGAKITTIFELANYCAKRGAKAQGINIGGKVEFKWGSAYWLPAVHSSSTMDGEYGGCPASVLLEIGGIKIFHAGDTGLHTDMKMIGEIYKPDTAMLPIGGVFTMGIDEAVIAAEWLGVKKVIPMHYGTFPPITVNIDQFRQNITAKPQIDCIILKPNESYSV